jgi:type IV pilus assembly protein PilB
VEVARLPGTLLGELLVSRGELSQAQLGAVLIEQKDSDSRLGELLLARRLVSAAALARALADQYGLEFIDLEREQIDPEAASLLPQRLARRYGALPVRFVGDDVVLVAVRDPTDIFTADDLQLALGMPRRLGVAAADALDAAIAQHFGLEAVAGQMQEEEEEPDEADVIDIREAGASAPAIHLVHSLISRAIELGASDLHFEPQAQALVVRARVDGVLRELSTVRRSLQRSVISRLKIMGELNIAERRMPQDGRVTIHLGGEAMDLRIAVLPTRYGEHVTLRLQRRSGNRLELAELGISADAENVLRRAFSQPHGAIVTCGPTGSGKTTTLYAALRLLNNEGRSLMTIEDPIEYQLAGVNQIQVAPKAGLTFARGLRTILRSDPDVLLVGEIRDEETARIAIQAAMTGHLVLTTVHANTAASAVTRLRDMGAEPGLLEAALVCIVSQRLVRKLCEACREAYKPDAAERATLGLRSTAKTAVYRAVGCSACSGTGYVGRTAIFEILGLEGRVRQLLGASADEIHAAALENGMRTLFEDGLGLVLAGTTSLDEIRRITGDPAFQHSGAARPVPTGGGRPKAASTGSGYKAAGSSTKRTSPRRTPRAGS